MRTTLFFILLCVAPSVAVALTVGGSAQNPTCGLSNGIIYAYATGGQAPYYFDWSPAPAIGQGTSQISELAPGVWTVTVTDNLGAQATHMFTLTNLQVVTNVWQALTWVYDQSAAHHPCPGFQNGSISLMTSMLSGGVPPYTATMDGLPPLGYDMNTNEPYFGYFYSTDQVTIHVTDVNGCAGDAVVPIDSPQSLGASASNIDPACGGLFNGSADLTFGFAGPYGPDLWVGGPNGPVYASTPNTEPLNLSGLEAGAYTVYGAYLSQYFPAPGCDFNGYFTIPDLGPDCGSVSGRLFIDNNQNCVQSAGEPGVPYRVIEINPGPQYAITNAAGDYTRNLLNGNFNLQTAGNDLYPICPVVQPAPFTINYNSVTVDLADSSLIPLDVQLTAYADAARPGFQQSIWGDVRNLSAQLSGAITLTASFDAQMSFVSASPVPTSVGGNMVTWDFPALIAYGSQSFSLHLQVPPDANLIGQPYGHALSISQPVTESSTSNNSVSPSGIIVGAVDPNDKRAFTSTGWSDELYLIGSDAWVDYVIRFQNTGNAEAINVVVTDTLPAELDMGTFEQGAASHAFEVAFKNGRVVEWTFPSINLPDSGANEAASHGLLSFRIKPRLPILPGTVIENIANIFFDFNPAVITEPSVLVAEFSTGVEGTDTDQLSAYPIPASTVLNASVTGMQGTTGTCRVRALDGRVVHEQRVPGGVFSVPVEQLSAGAYVLEVLMNGEVGWRTRFLKQ